MRTVRLPSRATWRLHAAALAILVLTITLLPMASPARAAGGSTELVKNANFSAGLEGWRTNRPDVHPLTQADRGRKGTTAAVITPADRRTVVLNDVVNTVKGAVKGTTYTMTAWVRAEQGGATAAIKAGESGAGGRFSHEARVKLEPRKWTKVTLTFATRFEKSTLDLNVLFWGHKVKSELLVDTVSLVTSGAVDASPAAVAVTPVDSVASAKKCTRTVPTGTKFGSSISTSGQSHAQALAGVDAIFGRIPIVRVFDPGMPFSWSHSRVPMIAGRDLVMSFRPMPKDVLSGKHDAELKAWFAQAPSNVNIFWSYIHEPEPLIDKGVFTADQYRRAWQRIDSIADSVCRQNMYSTLILTGWTASPGSKRDWRTYYAGGDVIDVMAFDPYNGARDPQRDYYATPASLYDPVVSVARAAGKPWAIAETGSRRIPSDPTGKQRAAWLSAIGDYARSKGAVFVTYFNSTNGGEYRLLDGPSQSAWKRVVGSSR